MTDSDEYTRVTVEDRTAQVAAERLHERTERQRDILPLTIARAVLASVDRSTTPADIAAIVETLCLLEPGSVAMGGRRPRECRAREIIVMVYRKVLRMSFPEIARMIGAENHSTAISAYKRAERELAA